MNLDFEAHRNNNDWKNDIVTCMFAPETLRNVQSKRISYLYEWLIL